MDQIPSNLMSHNRRIGELETAVKDLGDKIDRLYVILTIKETPTDHKGKVLMDVEAALETLCAGVIDLQVSRQDMSTRLDHVEHRLSNLRSQGETY